MKKNNNNNMLHYKTQKVYKRNFRTHVLQIQSDIYIYIYTPVFKKVFIWRDI